MYEVKIVDTIYTIEEVESHDPRLIVNSRKCAGVCEFTQHHILIDKGLSGNLKIGTLRHELCHMVLAETQLSSKNKYTEEEVCELLAIYGHYIINEAWKFYGEIKDEVK